MPSDMQTWMSPEKESFNILLAGSIHSYLKMKVQYIIILFFNVVLLHCYKSVSPAGCSSQFSTGLAQQPTSIPLKASLPSSSQTCRCHGTS